MSVTPNNLTEMAKVRWGMGESFWEKSLAIKRDDEERWPLFLIQALLGPDITP